MRVLTKTGGVAATNGYLVADETARRCVVIDAPDHTIAPLIRHAHENGWTIEGLWLTHAHFDHIADHALVPDGPVLCHVLDHEKLRQPKRQLDIFEAISGFRVPLEIEPREPDGALEDGQELAVGSLRARVIHTPGHSPGHVCFYFEGASVLFGGDLIIGGSVGRTDLPDSDEAALYDSIRKVMRLPPATRLLSGHGPPTTLDQEQRYNPFVQDALETSSQ